MKYNKLTHNCPINPSEIITRITDSPSTCNLCGKTDKPVKEIEMSFMVGCRIEEFSLCSDCKDKLIIALLSDKKEDSSFLHEKMSF